MIKRITGIVAAALVLFVLIAVIANTGKHRSLLPHFTASPADTADNIRPLADTVQNTLPHADTLPRQDSVCMPRTDTLPVR